MPSASSNGYKKFWIVVPMVLVLALIGFVGVKMASPAGTGHGERIARVEEAVSRFDRDVRELREDVKELLRRVPPP